MKRRRIHILQMGKHFLYLPLYFARQNNFFGFLPEGVSVELDISRPQTDSGAFAQLMDNSPQNRDYVMAVTDPTQIFQSDLGAECQPVVLAAMVTNGAFWAVNHGTGNITALRQLGKFDRILAFQPGTTSYTIASRIAHESGNSTNIETFIQVVDPGKELLCLNDPITPANSVALSPDLLMIEHMLSEKSASIELALGGTPEFNDVLVTTLLSRSDFVDQNPEVVDGILAGIQRALLMIRLRNEEVLKFAQEYFPFDEHLEEHVEKAIDRAVKAGVFPLSIVVEKPHWQHAARAYYEAKKIVQGWDEIHEQTSLEYFDKCIKPHTSRAEVAANRVFGSSFKGNSKANDISTWARITIPIVSAIATAALGLLATLVLGVGAAILYRVIQLTFMKERLFLQWMFICFWVLGVVILALQAVPSINEVQRISNSTLESTALCFLSIAVAAVMTAYGMLRKGEVK